MRISDVLRGKNRDLIHISPDADIRHAVATMRREDVGALVVLGPDRGYLGLIAERHVLHAVAQHGSAAFSVAVKHLMCAAGPTASPADPVLTISRLMTERRTRHVAVVDGGKVIGLVSTGDLLKSRLQEKTDENSVLQDLARLSLVAA